MIEEHTLGNGLRVVVHPRRRVPLAAVNIRYGVGSRHEAPGRTGLAHLFEHLMFQGSAHVAEGEHAAVMERAGAPYDGETWWEHTTYHQTVPIGHLDLTLWLEADRMGTLPAALSRPRLDNQRDVVKNEIRQRLFGRPYGTAIAHLPALAFPEAHPYAHTPLGSAADLDATTTADCLDFHAAHYAPDNAVLAVAGDVDPGRVFEAAERRFGHLARGAGRPEARDGAVGPARGEARMRVAEEVPAPALFRVYRLPADGTPEIEAADLALRLLGEGRHSRLHDRLVRRDGLAPACETQVHRFAGTCSLGVLAVYAAEGADLAAVEEALDAEILRLSADGPRAEEITRLHAQAERRFLDRTSTLAGLAGELTLHALQFGDAGRAFTAARRASAVTGGDVAAAATRLTPDNRGVLIYEKSR
ncbi:M16 family metallopeptidase [Sinosporangium siamense]|uniref:Zinc protease n=1 Tax=Sinosporangium siamense TaxID=1367973 RepID=A0A919RMW7_9ACTN|nr:pitrilysin family protein [Sinosporangium siamense]GII95096.1 zinc protease [Sinosporangium siamense]